MRRMDRPPGRRSGSGLRSPGPSRSRSSGSTASAAIVAGGPGRRRGGRREPRLARSVPPRCGRLGPPRSGESHRVRAGGRSRHRLGGRGVRGPPGGVVIASPPPVYPWPIGVGPRYHPTAYNPAVSSGRPVGVLRCSSGGGELRRAHRALRPPPCCDRSARHRRRPALAAPTHCTRLHRRGSCTSRGTA